MESITLSTAWGWILAGAVALVSLSKAWEIIRKYAHPEADLREKVQKHDDDLGETNRRLKALEQSMNDRRKFERTMSRVMLAQLNHELSGNDVEHLREARDKLNDYLTEGKD